MAIFDIKWSIPFDFWPKRATKKALFLYILILNILSVFIIVGLYQILKDIKLLILTIHFINFILVSGLTLLLLNLILFLCWLYWRSSPRISNNEIGILFAPHSDEEASDLIYALYRQVLIELKNSSVDKIRCRLLPSNIIVTNPGIANEQLVKSGARLIIYGHFSRGNIENEKFEGFKNITFFVRHRNLHEIEKQPVLRDLASALAFRKFTFSEKNSFLDKTIVAENISNVALFFISVGLTLDGRIEEAICILDGLLQNFEPLRGNQPHLRYFENSIKSCLTVALNSKCMYLYETHLMDNVTNKEFDPVALELEKLNNRLLKLNRQTSDFYLQKGIIEFHFGRLKYSWEAIKQARALSPKNEPIVDLSLAFLYLWEGKYETSLRFYKMAQNCTTPNHRPIMQVIAFLQGVLKNNPKKYIIKFALALINDHYLDSSIAIEDYNSFLAEAENDTAVNKELPVLVRYANTRLKSCGYFG